ncbi:MAG TPA: aldolase/citrate lyase family protein [Ilumatobacter sp.]|nr:aldolase/citrate lyase family protein [Ilumatobacter sp.]
MELPANEFKARLTTGAAVQWGMFTSLADPVAAEICAGAGFDFVVADTEHAPADLRTVLGQLQAMSAYPVEPVVRTFDDDPAVLKRFLDLGARTLLVPMVASGEQAAAIVRATRYGGDGVRGVSSARAARWGRVPGYHATADEQICVLVQVESAAALERLDEICAVPGVDGVFVGPMDLATSLGYVGGGTHPDVVAVVEATLRRIAEAGATPGVLASTPDLIGRYVAAGARFVAAGVDTMLLARATSDLRESLPGV